MVLGSMSYKGKRVVWIDHSNMGHKYGNELKLLSVICGCTAHTWQSSYNIVLK